MTYYQCESCKAFYQEGEEETATVNGRVGHPDNWEPDSTYVYCPHCNADITEGGAYEVGVEEMIDMLEAMTERFNKAINMARAINGNLGNAMDPNTLAHAWGEKIKDLELDR